MIRVTVWNEFFHERTEEAIRAIYPEGIHQELANFLGQQEDITVRTATLEDPECGLTDEVLENTDVLIWWGHMRHALVLDEIAAKVQNRVLSGMGLIALHSSHKSKPFMRLMGTTGSLRWRENGDRERIWIIQPDHPITRGLPQHFVVEHEEMYGEPFDIPTPDELLMIGWFQGGDVFRSGCCFNRGRGKIFYFQPGHESYPTYKNPYVRQVILNAVRWAKNDSPNLALPDCPHVELLEQF